MVPQKTLEKNPIAQAGAALKMMRQIQSVIIALHKLRGVVEAASTPNWLLWSHRSLIKTTCISTEF